MRKWISAACVVAGLVVTGVGCVKDKEMDHKMTTQPMAGDCCPHCPGVQKMTADGKCPVCGMKCM